MTPQDRLKEIKDFMITEIDRLELNWLDMDWLIARVEQLEKVLEGLSDSRGTAAVIAEEALNTGPKLK